jgi:peptidoglycan/LPS O-acetylase OafA/YrhL
MERDGLDTLRLLAALLVMWGHAFVLHGDGVGYGFHAEHFGLYIFFLISGYLVTQSWTRDPNPARFTARRALRILPGLIVVVVLTVFALGPQVTSLPLDQYLRDGRTWAYLSGGALIPRYFLLPGTFPLNAWAGVANGSLWTLPLEAACYGLVVAAGLLRDRAPLLMFGVLLLAVWSAWMGIGEVTTNVAIFCVGSLMANFGVRLSLPLPKPPADISYGLYLYACPIQQTVIMLRPDWGAITCLAAALPVAVVPAVLSWRLVEAPALRMKPRTPRAGPHALLVGHGVARYEAAHWTGGSNGQ